MKSLKHDPAKSLEATIDLCLSFFYREHNIKADVVLLPKDKFALLQAELGYRAVHSGYAVARAKIVNSILYITYLGSHHVLASEDQLETRGFVRNDKLCYLDKYVYIDFDCAPPQAPSRCECGSGAPKGQSHSHWCPLLQQG